MKRTRYDQICNDVERGIPHTVEHEISHREGSIVACRRDNFVIDTHEHTENWARQNCHEPK